MKLRPSHLRCCALPLLVAAMAWRAEAQGPGAGLLEVQEANAALQIAESKVQGLESKVARSKEQIAALGEGLANASNEARQAREEYEKLRLQLEGLGIAALNGSNAELQQRLLSALSDLRILDAQKRQLTDALIGLSEAALSYAKAVPHASEDSQQMLNKSLTQAEKAIASAQADRQSAPESDLQNAKVVSVKEELGIAVLNVGSKQGVHPGMPITIYRQDRPVARALVADVRAMICGAIVQELVNENDAVKVGDVGKVQTSKS